MDEISVESVPSRKKEGGGGGGGGEGREERKKKEEGREGLSTKTIQS